MAHARSGHRALLVVSLLLVVILAGCTGNQNEEEPHPAMEGREDGWEITITLLGGEKESRHVFPSKVGHDYDRDAQDDLQEFLQGTDPNDADTSGNGLLDGENIVLSPDESPAQEWMDRGIAYVARDDGRLEFQGAFNWSVDPTMQDTAGNGIMDGEEVGGFDVWVLGESRTVRTDPVEFDTSNDGIDDGTKRKAGLDPTTADTDGDLIPDRSDVNPWIDFELRVEVVSLNLTSNPGGGNEASLWFQLQITGASWQGEPAPARVGETTDGEPFSSEPVNPSDDGGDFLRGRHNLTFALNALKENGGDASTVDLFSHSTGSTALVGAIHALTGDLYQGQGDDRQPWPSTATFQGEHGDITLRLVPVWPNAWQSCIDDGCRHGDGDFPWR